MLVMLKIYFWRLCRVMYTFAAKPLLFLMSPDTAHNMMIKTTSVVGRFGFFRHFVSGIFLIKTNPRLDQKINGVRFKAPVGLAAGFDKNGEIMPMISRLGFGFATVGSVTADVCAGNPRPWFYRLPKSKSLVVNAGLANHGSSKIIKRIHDYSQNQLSDFPIVLSVAKTNNQKVVDCQAGIKDYVASVKRAKNESRIEVIELNISCPNAYGGEPYTTPERLEALLAAVDKVGARQPIFIKMPVDHSWPDFRKLLKVIIKHKIAGVTVSNLFKDRQAAGLKEELPDTIKGNLSGQPTWHKSNDLIKNTYSEFGDKLTIIGVGGVFTAQDAYTKIKLGASLVEVITGVIFNGPQLAAEINYDLANLLKKDGFNHISQAVGVDVKK